MFLISLEDGRTGSQIGRTYVQSMELPSMSRIPCSCLWGTRLCSILLVLWCWIFFRCVTISFDVSIQLHALEYCGTL